MTDYRDGEIHIWNGGECPVHPKDGVRVWGRLPRLVSDASAKSLDWTHDGYAEDIIAFRVVKKHVEPEQVAEPLTIWVNIYPGGQAIFLDRRTAENCALEHLPGRIAVPFREVKE